MHSGCHVRMEVEAGGIQLMAGGTKCYKVTMVDGKPVREVVSYSPKHADPADVAVGKLTGKPPVPAIVRFHEIGTVEQQVTAEPAPLALDAPTGSGKTLPATEMVGLLCEEIRRYSEEHQWRSPLLCP